VFVIHLLQPKFIEQSSRGHWFDEADDQVLSLEMLS
jgi:hypothetical protein